jgi:drug/metabolite transporter (DMT)-like permease
MSLALAWLQRLGYLGCNNSRAFSLEIFIEPWVLWTLLAAVMQSIRTAGQKVLVADISTVSATLVRYLFGLPFALFYLCWLLSQRSWQIPPVNVDFLICGLLAGILQIVATVLLIQLLTLRNFAVGSTFVRSEIVLTALIGVGWFAERVSLFGWLSILVCVGGLVLISVAKTGLVSSLWNRSAVYGLGAGLCFAMTSLLLRRASLSLSLDDAMFSAAITLVYMVLLQTAITVVWVAVRQPQEFIVIGAKWRPCLFVGATAVAGSIGWFTAMTLELAAYVKTLGQIEFLISLLIAIYLFKERPSSMELLGMLLIVGGAVGILLV